jgi:hypothetical protein
MSYKPDESTLVAFLYGELEGLDKEKVERYMLETPEARMELEALKHVRKLMSCVEDKEVIAPSLVIDGRRNRLFSSPYFRTIVSIAASLLAILIVGKLTDVRIKAANREFTISFGEKPVEARAVQMSEATLTPTQVQQMINSTLSENNVFLRENWKESQEKLDASIRRNLALNSSKIDKLVNEASSASQRQIADYVASLQTQNMQSIKDYYKLTASEQKEYIEELLVDFAKYLQQQRNDDLSIMQSRMNTIEESTGLFQHETEQILSSIISNSNLSVMKNQ